MSVIVRKLQTAAGEYISEWEIHPYTVPDIYTVDTKLMLHEVTCFFHNELTV